MWLQSWMKYVIRQVIVIGWGGMRWEESIRRTKPEKWNVDRDEAFFLWNAYYKLFRYCSIIHAAPFINLAMLGKLFTHFIRNGIFCFTFFIGDDLFAFEKFIPFELVICLHDRWPQRVQTSSVESRLLSNNNRAQQSHIQPHTQTLRTLKDILLLNDSQDFRTFRCYQDIKIIAFQLST